MTSKRLSNVVQTWECEDHCMSQIHGNLITSAVAETSLSDIQIAHFVRETCKNFGKVRDESGRTALHVASTIGRNELCVWLISSGSDPNCKDDESGSTPLHRSIYHGHIDTSIILSKHGSSLNAVNNEGLTPLNLLNIDITKNIRLAPNMPCQVYVWGTNFNYTLGTGTNDPKKSPECLEFFKKNFTSIKQVCMDKFHSVFVTAFQTAWVCGQGERLGVGKDLLLLPSEMLTRGEPCEQAAIAMNHTIILLANGTVLASGQNKHHQLGILPYSLSTNHLKYVNLSNAKWIGQIKGIGAGKYHSLFYNDRGILVCGFNGGQLGCRTAHDSFITQPSLLSIQLKKYVNITNVATSDGCISYALDSGDIFIIHQYQYKRIATKQKILKLCCTGGILDVENAEKEELRVAFLTSKGSIYVWQQDILLKCDFEIGRSLMVHDFHLNSQCLLVVTKRGEAYSAELNPKQPMKKDKFFEPSIPLNVAKLYNVHRAVAISSDPSGKNYSVIQTHPSNALENVPVVSDKKFGCELKSLLNETTENDYLHDIIVQAKHQSFPAHRFILASRGCDIAFHNENVMELKNTEPAIFNEFLNFIYTGECDLLTIGPCPEHFKNLTENPLLLLKQLSVDYGIKSLTSRLQNLTYLDGLILKGDSDIENHDDIKFDRKLFPELYDVEFVSEEGKSFPAHKCILASSLDYFKAMFLSGWSETKKRPIINFHCSSSILENFIEFIYTKRIAKDVSNDIDAIMRLLKVSDQYLATTLKEECEMMLCALLNLRNCISILQVADMFNAFQLKKSTLEFICLNFNAILESRQLEALSLNILKELKDYYLSHNQVNFMDRKFSACEQMPKEMHNFINSGDFLEMPKLVQITSPEPKQLLQNKKKTPKKQIIEKDIEKISLGIKEMEIEKVEPPSPSDFSIYGSPEYTKDFPSFGSQHKIRDRRKFICHPFNTPSQKERKRNNSKSETEEVKSPPKTEKVWATIAPVVSIQNEPSIKMSDIIASEERRRSNLMKIKSKPFELTQMEDSAMEDLLNFYSASQVFDEKITVGRVVTEELAQPSWIRSQTFSLKI